MDLGDPVEIGLEGCVRAAVEQAARPNGVDGAGCLLMHADGALRSIGTTGAASRALETAEELAVEGPCHEAFLSGDVVQVPDVFDEDRWPRFTSVIGAGPFRTILGVPVRHAGAPMGAINCFSSRPRQWGRTDTARLTRLADAIGAALGRALDAGLDRRGDALAAELRTAMERRELFARAAREVADATGRSEWEASLRIRQVAAAIGSSLPEMCQQVLTRRGLPSPSELGEQAAEVRRLRDQMTQLALTDPLTGLANRALLLDRLHHALAAVPRGGPAPTVIFLDLDRFKVINDSLGHEAGDQVLRTVARRIGSEVREHDTVSRLGGDEFAVVIEGDHDHAHVADVAARVADSVARPIEVWLRGPGDADPRPQEVTVTASLGVAEAQEGHRDAADLLRDADLAMYHAKRHHNRRVQFFTARLRERGRRRWHIETLLREALDGPATRRPWLVYQPVVTIGDGRTVGFEALTRWSHRQLGDVGAVELVAAAEESGLIGRLGTLLLADACRQAAEWLQLQPGLFVCVNVAAQQLTDDGFAVTVQDVLDGVGVAPSQLHLEMTETQLLTTGDEVDGVARTLHQLDEMGVGISLDDFGTGFSSLTHVTRLPVDTLKIDQSFVQCLSEDPGSSAVVHATAVVNAIVGLAETLELTVVAEGVETREQHDRLIDLGCRLAQGYRYGRPEQPAALGDRIGPSPQPTPAAGHHPEE